MTLLMFDLDGTLLDTLEDLLNATNYALSAHGYPTVSLPRLRRAVGNGAANQIRRCLPEGTSEEVAQAVLATYKPYYTAHCEEKTCPYPGIPEALAELKAQYPIAIVSNKPDAAVQPLCSRHFPGIFALGERPGCPRKPDPAMVKNTMAALGADRCIYIGDSEVDVLTARNAGVPCLCVTWGFRDEEDLIRAGAEHLCRDTRDLARCLRELDTRF